MIINDTGNDELKKLGDENMSYSELHPREFLFFKDSIERILDKNNLNLGIKLTDLCIICDVLKNRYSDTYELVLDTNVINSFFCYLDVNHPDHCNKFMEILINLAENTKDGEIVHIINNYIGKVLSFLEISCLHNNALKLLCTLFNQDPLSFKNLIPYIINSKIESSFHITSIVNILKHFDKLKDIVTSDILFNSIYSITEQVDYDNGYTFICEIYRCLTKQLETRNDIFLKECVRKNWVIYFEKSLYSQFFDEVIDYLKLLEQILRNVDKSKIDLYLSVERITTLLDRESTRSRKVIIQFLLSYFNVFPENLWKFKGIVPYLIKLSSASYDIKLFSMKLLYLFVDNYPDDFSETFIADVTFSMLQNLSEGNYQEEVFNIFSKYITRLNNNVSSIDTYQDVLNEALSNSDALDNIAAYLEIQNSLS